jgi:hypothetical protein
LRSAAFKLRAEKVERSFEHNLDRGGMRHTWLRGWENVQKSYLMQVAAYNLGLVMRACCPQRRPAAVVRSDRRARHPHRSAARHLARPNFVNGLLSCSHSSLLGKTAGLRRAPKAMADVETLGGRRSFETAVEQAQWRG